MRNEPSRITETGSKLRSFAGPPFGPGTNLGKVLDPTADRVAISSIGVRFHGAGNYRA
jgi:hypothetical protein